MSYLDCRVSTAFAVLAVLLILTIVDGCRLVIKWEIAKPESELELVYVSSRLFMWIRLAKGGVDRSASPSDRLTEPNAYKGEAKKEAGIWTRGEDRQEEEGKIRWWKLRLENGTMATTCQNSLQPHNRQLTQRIDADASEQQL